MKNIVFWDVALCTSCVNRRFGGTYRLRARSPFLAPKLLGQCSLSSPGIFPITYRSSAAYRPPSATCCGLTFTTDPTPLLSVDFPCGLVSLSPCFYIVGYFRLVAQSADTCSRWFPARRFFSTLKMEAIRSSETSVNARCT
jgi:hypothetical protein